MGNLIINDNLFLRQYEVEIEDDLAIIEYALQDRENFFNKTYNTFIKIKMKTLKTPLLDEVFEIIKEKNIRIMPTSSSS